MSYAKAMKHARNVRKCRKQANMHFGFDTGSGKWPAASPACRALDDIRRWFKWRHDDAKEKGYKYVRECIQEKINEYRLLTTTL